MTEQIKDLIEKIQREGVKAAEDKAKEIEDQAQRQAEEIIKKAKIEAEKIISEAKKQADKTEHSTKVLLQQAGRDLMLGLRKEINAMLDKIVVNSVQEALNPEELVEIIDQLVKSYSEKEKIVISLKRADLEKLEKGLLSGLGKEVKKGVTLKAQDDIRAGFIISYDAGKSFFDFTDKALAEYISSYLKPRLKEILQ